MPTVTRLTSNGVFQSLGGFDEVSLNSGSIYFNGSSYFNVPYQSLQLSNQNFTIECWFYYASSAAAGLIGQVGSAGVSNDSYTLRYSGANTVAYYLSSTGSSYDIANGILMGNTTPNAWNHVALVRNGNTITPYVNGFSGVSTTTSSALFSSTQNLGVGAFGGGSGILTGYMSNIRIVKGSSLYTANFAPPTMALSSVANTVLLLTANPQNIFKDSSSNNLSLIINGTPQFNTLGPFYYPANTSINLANTNNNPALGSNTNIITSTTSNGVVMISNGFDEVSMSTGSLFFNGSTSRLQVPNTNIGNLTGNPFTIECWAYLLPMNTSWTNGFVANIFATTSTSGSSGGNFGLQLILNGTTTSYTSIQLYLNNGTISSTFAYAFSLRTWYHIALTRTAAGVFTIYINGTSVGTVTNATTWTDNSPYGIGYNQQSTYSDIFSGYISNFRLDIGAPLYTGNFTPSTKQLTSTANTKLLLNTTLLQPFVDSSSNNNTLTSTSITSSSITPPIFGRVSQRTSNTGTMYIGSYFNEVDPIT